MSTVAPWRSSTGSAGRSTARSVSYAWRSCARWRQSVSPWEHAQIVVPCASSASGTESTASNEMLRRSSSNDQNATIVEKRIVTTV